MTWSEESEDRRAEYNSWWWRTYGPAYNRAHPRRAIRLAPVSRTRILEEDIAQQRQLARLTRRQADNAEAYGARERHWIFQSAISIVSYDEHLDGEGIQL